MAVTGHLTLFAWQTRALPSRHDDGTDATTQ